MRNLTEMITNRMFNEIVDRAVREAVRLQKEADLEYQKQKDLEQSGQPYNYMKSHTLREGVHGLTDVLWTIFGGLPVDSINAIEKITRENKSSLLGHDCQDYVELFLEAFQAR